MNTPWTLLLNDGTLAALAAMAMYVEKPRLMALYIHDGRTHDLRAYDCFIHQCEHFKTPKHVELTLAHLAVAIDAPGDESGVSPRAPLADIQELMAAAGLAVQLKAERLVWPIQAGENFDTVARLTESIQLVQQLIRLERGYELAIDTPLMEMTDRQLVEVGHQMQTPWALSRSCMQRTHEPCGQCGGCKRRAAAFAEAGLEDPLAAPMRS